MSGVHHWQAGDPQIWIAAAIRLVAPLVACWLWERRLRGDRAVVRRERTEQRVVTRIERRTRRRVALRHRHVRRVALAAVASRHAAAICVQNGVPLAGGARALVFVWRAAAASRLRRRHVSFWRHYPLTEEENHRALMDGLTAAGLADVLPDLTIPRMELIVGGGNQDGAGLSAAAVQSLTAAAKDSASRVVGGYSISIRAG